MDCSIAAEGAATAQHALDQEPYRTSRPSASLCVSCELRERCLGATAAQAGTAQLQGIIAGRPSLQARQVLYRPDEPFTTVYVVRSGALMSTLPGEDGEAVLGLHFPGELVGMDGLVSGRQRAKVTALEDTQVCALRFAPRTGDPAGARAFFSRLWDMMSCQVVRERAHQSLLATLPPARRIAAFLASVAARRRGRKPRPPLAMSTEEMASYLRLPESVVRAEQA
jgi:CRP/FNR family transcriptional regulator